MHQGTVEGSDRQVSLQGLTGKLKVRALGDRKVEDDLDDGGAGFEANTGTYTITLENDQGQRTMESSADIGWGDVGLSLPTFLIFRAA